MTKDELKNIIRECITEIKQEKDIHNIIKESLKPMTIEKEHSLVAKMAKLADAIKSVNKDATMNLDDAKRYNVCDCNPHHFRIYPMTDDNFTVTHFKNNTDRTKKFNLTFEELKKFVIETLKENKADFGQEKWEKCVVNSEDKESKRGIAKAQEVDKKIENSDDLPTSPMKTVDNIKKQSDHSVKGEKSNYKYPKQMDNNHVIKLTTFKDRSNKK